MASLPIARPRWDPLVRIAHWGIAAGVVANRLLIEAGSGLHLWIGYAVAGLLALRSIWGLVGSAPARFTSFPPGLAAAVRHVRDIRIGRRTAYPSHNPLGALMAYALWATLLVVVGTGIVMAQADSVTFLTVPPVGQVYRQVGPISSEDNGEAHEARTHEERDEGLVGEVHELAANLLLVLAILHLAGVAFESGRGERGLVRAMITGDRGHD